MNALYSRIQVCMVIGLLSVFSCHAYSQLASPKASAKTITEVPFTITQSGVYVVKKDLTLSTGTTNAITVAADNVVVDLGGHVISCSASQDLSNVSCGVASLNAGVKNVTVRNGRLQNFRYGIYLVDNVNATAVGDALVEDVTVLNSGLAGISLRAASLEVRNCRVYKTGYLSANAAITGISVTGANVIVRGNEVGKLTVGVASATGISVTTSCLGLVEDNVVSSIAQGNTGISCSATSPAKVFAVRNSINNFAYGLTMAGTGGGKYRQTNTKNCTTPFQGGTAIGSENN